MPSDGDAKTEAGPRAVQVDVSGYSDLDQALVQMYFAWKGITREADDVLASFDLGRAHYRMMFVVARRDGITVGELRENLGVTAQAMQRPLRNLLDRGLVAVSRDPRRHRYKALHLTARGRAIELAASDAERRVMSQAFAAAGPEAAQAWRAVMAAISREA